MCVCHLCSRFFATRERERERDTPTGISYLCVRMLLYLYVCMCVFLNVPVPSFSCCCAPPMFFSGQCHIRNHFNKALVLPWGSWIATMLTSCSQPFFADCTDGGVQKALLVQHSYAGLPWVVQAYVHRSRCWRCCPRCWG